LPEYEGFQDEKQHWKADPNTAAHIRLKDRIGPNGEKILHVEEVQSDWGQVGRQRGFGKSRLTLRPGEIEPAPYVTNTESWTDLALKRVMHEAAKGGYDKVMWTPGDAQAKRYNLSNHIDTLAYLPYQDESGKTKYKLRAGKDGRMLMEQSGLDEQGLASHVGKEMAQKIIDGHKTDTRDINTVVGGDNRSIGQRKAMTPWNVISGLDLNVGGQGMMSYYDKIVPNAFKRILKDHGGVEFGSTEKMSLRLAYEKARAEHERAYEQAVTAHQRAFSEAADPHQRAYYEALATHRRALDEAIATHRSAFNEAIATHRSAFNEAIAPHWRAYDEAVATHQRAYDEAIAPHQRALDEASARGEDVDDPGFPKLPSFDVTPEMRESILTNGFKTFARGGEVEKSAMNDDSINRALLVAARASKAAGGVPQEAINSTLPPEVLQELASQFEKVRDTKIGRTVARYQTPPAQQAVQTMYNDLYKMAREGTPGRYWYEKSSKDILRHVGGDKNLADKFAQLIAIYSPQTTVPINTGNAIKAYNRAMAGQPIWKGEIINPDISFNTIAEANKYIRSLGGKGANITKVPLDDSGKRFLIARHDISSYENIATADRDLRAHLLMNHDLPFEGRKINNFYNNLMVHIDPSRLQGSTQDLWMAHAFGFPDTAIGAAGKYTFMERLTQHLADELGWRPHQVQAAIWTAVKTRMEATSDAAKKLALERGLARMVPGDKGKLKFQPNEGALGQKISRSKILKSSKDFSDFLRENLAHVSWESTPSTKIDHLSGIHDLPYEAKAEYHGLISKALQDEKGNDLLAKYLGILSPGSVDAPGYWEGSVNPASQLLVGSTRIKAAGQRADLDEPSRELMEIYSAAKGLLHKQDGAGYHRPFFNPQVTKANGIQFTFDKDLDHDHIINIGKNLDPDFALIPVNNRTLRVLNLDKNAADQRKFHDAVSQVVQQHVPDEFGVSNARAFTSDGNLVGNDWEKYANGESYIQRISASKRPDVLGYVANVLAPRVEAVDREFAEKYGLKTDPRIEASIRNASQEGQPQEQVSQPLDDASTQRALALTAPQKLAAARVMAAPQPGRRYKP
jgi:tetratricopeptide (TPR) repeat protein